MRNRERLKKNEGREEIKNKIHRRERQRRNGITNMMKKQRKMTDYTCKYANTNHKEEG